ncbi:MAG TPA: dihydroneopterin aldolase [Candidatus Nitrosotalea sp.]|nr:dihydroneopterin aldolase [Candidatus Nitrosotalea sp.]
MDMMLLSGMTFFGRHGALAAERELGARYTVDAELGLAASLDDAGDRRQDVLDYTSVYEQVQQLVEGEPVNLVETLAVRIAQALIAQPGVSLARVRVHKRPLVTGEFDDFAIEVTRER